MWRKINSSSFLCNQAKVFSDDVVAPNDTSIRCVDNPYVVRIPNGDLDAEAKKPIHAHLTQSLPTVAGVPAAKYAAGQSPTNATYDDFVVQGLLSGTGIFQFVSLQAHQEVESSQETPIIHLLRNDVAKSGDEPLIFGGRFAYKSLIKVEGGGQQGSRRDVLRYALEVVDLHANTSPPTTITVPITQVGLKFDKRVLEPNEIRRANTLFEEHCNTSVPLSIVSGSEASAAHLILSREGFGRNATLITYRKINALIFNGLVFEATLDSTLQQHIVADRIRCGPQFITSMAQLAELRTALWRDLSSAKSIGVQQLPKNAPRQPSSLNLRSLISLEGNAANGLSSMQDTNAFPVQLSPLARVPLANKTPHLLLGSLAATGRAASILESIPSGDDRGAKIEERNSAANSQQFILQIPRPFSPNIKTTNQPQHPLDGSTISESDSEMGQDFQDLYSSSYRTNLVHESEEWLFPIYGGLDSHQAIRFAMADNLEATHDVQRIDGEKQRCWLRSSWLSALIMLRPEDLKQRLLSISEENESSEKVQSDGIILEAIAKLFHANPIKFLQYETQTTSATELKWHEHFNADASLGPSGHLDKLLGEYVPPNSFNTFPDSLKEKSIEKFLRNIHLQIAAAYCSEKGGEGFVIELENLLENQPGLTDLPVLLHRALGLPNLVIESGSEVGGGSSLQLRVTAPKDSPLEEKIKRINAQFFDNYNVEKMITDLFNEFKSVPIIKFVGCHFDLYIPKDFTSNNTVVPPMLSIA